MAVKNTLYRLGVFGSLYVAACTFPPALGVVGLLSNPEAQELLKDTCQAIASVIAGNVANALGDATTGHPGVSLKNHDLIEAVGKAIAAVITHKAVPEFKQDSKTCKNLLKIAKITPEKWVSLWSLWLNEDTGESERYPELGEGKLPDILIPKGDEILKREDWEDIFARLNMEACRGGGFVFPDGVFATVSQLLYDEFPQAFRQTLKEDFAEDGKAFAGLMLDLLTGLRIDLARLSKHQDSHFQSVLSQLLKLKNDGEASQAYQIQEFSKIPKYFDDLQRKLEGNQEQQSQTLREISARLESSYRSIRDILHTIPLQLEEIQAGVDQVNQGIEEIKTLLKSSTILPIPEMFGDGKPVDFEAILQQILEILQESGCGKDVVEFAQTALPSDAIVGDNFYPSELSSLTQILRYQCLDKFLSLLENKTSQREPDNLPQPLESYVLVTVESQKKSEQVIVNAWLVEDNSLIQNDPNAAFKPLLDEVGEDGLTCTQAEIQIWLNKSLRKALKLLRGKRYHLTIEVFLPKEFLSSEVDQWQLEFDPVDSETCWGMRYGLRVRSLERLNLNYLDNYLNQWYENWGKVSQILDQHPPLESFESLEDLHSLNSRQLPHQLNQKIGLKLTCPTASEQFEVLVKAILQAATPIALWPRCPNPNSNYADSMNQLLTCRPLRQLSESVRELRSASQGNSPDHLGCHLGFLWEDPYRLTPEMMIELMQPGE
ncbi:MAG: hypothetical protein EA414_04655 [Arthrospira sp. PLM2.Bin9]|nr:hypothetical protein [Arthrospira sp. PLM2.Bin9]TVU54901.1 MAG: hypothetical protein EA414_04655 [Arthrospira sp. PLM2.Bin9]